MQIHGVEAQQQLAATRRAEVDQGGKVVFAKPWFAADQHRTALMIIGGLVVLLIVLLINVARIPATWSHPSASGAAGNPTALADEVVNSSSFKASLPLALKSNITAAVDGRGQAPQKFEELSTRAE